MFKKIIILLFIAAISITFIGCDGDSTSITNPNPNKLQPTGTIQGRLTDKSTNEPIVGAIIDIGVGKATTSETGQFVISDVPATQDALNDTVTGSYKVTIDMRSVSSPVNMQDETVTTRYADFYLRTSDVEYTSLDDTNATNAGGGSGSNHDTPVTGLACTEDYRVGKMAASLNGVVAGCEGTADFFTPVGTGYTVYLFSGGTDNTGMGNEANLVASTTTDDNGGFTFNNVESMTHYGLAAVNADQSMLTSGEWVEWFSPPDGITEIQSIQASTALHVCSTDVHGPCITSVSPEPGSDLTPATGQTVVFTFSDPVYQSAFASGTGPSGIDDLYDHIDVMYEGMKANNIAYSLAWNATFDALTVTFDTAPSSLYWVRIINIDDVLEDANHQEAEMCAAPDDSDAPGAYSIAADGDDDDATVWFTTKGALDVTAPVIVLQNSTNIDNPSAPILNWSMVSGAKEYYVYRATVETWGATDQISSYELIGETIFSNYTDVSLVFDEGGVIQLTYNYMVTAVNSDGIESAYSNVVTAGDVIEPRLTNVAGVGAIGLPADGATDTETITLTFSEDMEESEAATVANYNIAKKAGANVENVIPVVTDAVQISTTEVELTVSITNPSGDHPTAAVPHAYTIEWVLDISSSVTDIAGNTIDTDADRYDAEFDVIE